MYRLFFVVLLLLPSLTFADGWEFRLGVSSFPEQNTLFGAELTRVYSLTDNLELGVGGVLRTDFTSTVGPGLVVRLRDWFAQHFAVGAVGEIGYLYHNGFSNPDSYTYLFVGPLLGMRFSPLFVQWEPGVLFFQGTSQFLPLRFVLGLSF